MLVVVEQYFVRRGKAIERCPGITNHLANATGRRCVLIEALGWIDMSMMATRTDIMSRERNRGLIYGKA
jgi:hypothetical protein